MTDPVSAPDRRARTIAYLTLCITMLFWAGNSIVGRAVAQDIPPFTLSFVRWTGALILITPFAWTKVREDWPVLRRHWRPTLLLGLTGVGAFNALLYTGLHHTTATNGLLLQAAIPPLVLLVSYLLFRDRSAIGQVVGVIFSLIGVVLVVTRADLAVLINLHFGRGDILVLIAVLFWAVYTSCLRLKPAVHGVSLLYATFTIGAVCMAILAAATEVEQIRAIPATGKVLFAFAYVSVLPSLVAYQLFNRAVGVLGAGKAGQMISLMPLFGAVIAAWLLAEPLRGYHFVGMALILAGIILSALGGRRKPG